MNKRLTKIQKLVAARRTKVATKTMVATPKVENLPASNTAELESVEAPVNETPVELTPTIEESKVENTQIVDATVTEEPVADNQISEESNETTPKAPVSNESTESAIDDGLSKKGRKGKKRKNTEE